MKKLLGIIIMTMAILCLPNAIFAKNNTPAQTKQETHLKVGTIYKYGEYANEKIIQVNSDGSFITEKIDSTNLFSVMRAVKNCKHDRLLEISTRTETSNVATKSCCYKTRSIIKSRCAQCNKIFTTYGKWSNHKAHSYKLLDKTCKVCGYKK